MNTKIGLLFLIMVSTVSLSVGQVKLEAGVRGGANFSVMRLTSADPINHNYMPGVHFGGYGKLRYKDFALQPEILYSRQGEYFTIPSWTDLNTKLDYINVPVLLKYYVIGTLNVYAGPQVGLLVSAKGSEINKLGPSLANQKTDIKQYFKGTDFSLVYGLGFDLNSGVSFGIRYAYGISDVNNITNGAATSTSSSIVNVPARNNVWSLAFSYRLWNPKKEKKK